VPNTKRKAYQWFESYCPAPRYADLFSRYQHNDKWDRHGNEAPLEQDCLVCVRCRSLLAVGRPPKLRHAAEVGSLARGGVRNYVQAFGSRSASKIGSITSLTAVCTTQSRMVGIAERSRAAVGLGTRLASGRYVFPCQLLPDPGQPLIQPCGFDLCERTSH
jgi:hypothetical protein